MPTDIVVAIITGFVTVFGTVVTVLASSSKTREEIKINQAITNEQIKNLSDEVKMHNEFARRMPALEQKIDGIETRLCILERKAE